VSGAISRFSLFRSLKNFEGHDHNTPEVVRIDSATVREYFTLLQLCILILAFFRPVVFLRLQEGRFVM
jgi:hypothetical protein